MRKRDKVARRIHETEQVVKAILSGNMLAFYRVTTKVLRAAKTWFATLFAVAFMTACGGGDTVNETAAERQFQALSGSGRDGINVVELTQVSAKHVERSVFDFVYQVTVQNDAQARVAVEAAVTGAGAGTTIVDGRVLVGDLAAQATSTPEDTITLRRDRRYRFDATALVWRFRSLPVVPAIVPGAALYNYPAGRATVGVPYEAVLRIASNDQRNPITSLQVANSTAGGAQPSISLDGRLTWTPSDADFGTSVLRVIAALQGGASVPFDVPVTVTKYRLVAQVPLNGAGRYSDIDGRYVVSVSGTTAAAVVSGTLTIRERFDANGNYTHAITSSDSSHLIQVVRAPIGVVRAGTTATANWAGRARAASAGRVRALESSPALKYQEWIFGTVIDEGVNLYTTRLDANVLGAFPTTEVARVENNCYRDFFGVTNTCAAKPGTPVILIHGFTPEVLDLGGGVGTWGVLAERLSALGHPVFELRWRTQMRFEEAAGLLVTLGATVSQATGRKPYIIAHSFGGIAAHLALAGEGTVWNSNEARWVRKSAGSKNAPMFDGLVTLGSPLSGINDDSANPDFVVGRHDTDATINRCMSVTCVQAGAFDMIELNSLRRNVEVIDSVSGLSPGESIKRIRDAWGTDSIALASRNIHTVVSMRERPFDDKSPDLSSETAYELGDGLISLVGQAVVASDFTCRYFITLPKAYDVPLCLSTRGFADFLNRIDVAPRESLSDSLLHATLDNGHQYYFALRAAHSSIQQNFVGYQMDPHRIAYYEDPVTVVETLLRANYEAAHPLRYFIDNVLKRTNPTPAVLNPVTGPVSGRVLLDTTGFDVTTLPAWIAILKHDSDVPVLSKEPLRIDATGGFTFDAAAKLRAELDTDVLLSDYRVRLEFADGISFYQQSWTSGRLLNTSNNYEVGLISLVSVSAQVPLVNVAGTVRVEGTSTPVAGAEIWLAMGINLSANEVRSLPESLVARHVVADANGALSAVGLRSGEYTVLASRSGYADSLQGRVVIDGSQALSIQLQPINGALFVDNFDRVDDTVVGNGWTEWMYYINASGLNRFDIVSITGSQLRVAKSRLGSNEDGGVYRPLSQICGIVLSGKVDFRGVPAASAFVNVNSVASLNTLGLNLVMSPALNGPHYIYFYHEGALLSAPVPFAFDVSVPYRYEWSIKSDCSTEVRVWKEGQARPVASSGASPAVTPVSRPNPLLMLGASGGAGCCTYPGFDVRFDDFSVVLLPQYDLTLTISPSVVQFGGSATVSWNTGGAPISACSMTRFTIPLPYPDAPTGSFPVTNIQGQIRFTLTCGTSSITKALEVIPQVGGG